MKNRLSKRIRALLGVAYLFVFCGLTYSCVDDYDLAEKPPTWLGSSIYDELQQRGIFTNYVKLIDDLEYTEVLAKTGSRTLFVTSDEAFQKFYADNAAGVNGEEWRNATSYANLTLAQKRIILNSSMITNAYLMELLPNLPGSGAADDVNSLIVKGAALRRVTSLAITDSIPYFEGTNLPMSYSDSDKDYWSRFRTKGIHLALDNTTPMMMHFLAAQMANKNITDSDFELLTGKARGKNDAYIFGSKVVEQDITCQNGYINVIDKVLITPSNMAETLRSNGRTAVFSHMLDRFSVPFYNASLTNSYQLVGRVDVDSVFQKRYFSARSQGGSPLQTDPNGQPVGAYLTFDPGWNHFFNSSASKEEDMAAMFVPTDEVLTSYFISGGGKFLLDAYGTEFPVTPSNLLKNIDQIPLDVIQALINNLMKLSFTNSVPSKFFTILDDAQDPMGIETSHIDTVLLANNGAVYLMNRVFTPARYAAVSSPAYVGRNMRIFNWAINNGSVGTTDFLGLNYYAYLLAMSSRFSFFIPTDEALSIYYDPVTMESDQPRVFAFNFNPTARYQDQITARARIYDPVSHEVGDTLTAARYAISNAMIRNRLKDMLEAHTVIHEGDEVNTGILSGNNWYLSKNGAPIYVENPNNNTPGWKVSGGWQITKNDPCIVEEIHDKTAETNGNGNGMTYVINRPLQATIKTVYGVMNDNGSESNPYKKFFDICQVPTDVLVKAGIRTVTEQTKYSIFIRSNTRYSLDFLVRFFNSFNYTIYTPTNAAMEAAHNNGLPTWEEAENMIDKWIADGVDGYEIRAQAMITSMVNFAKYHFQDNSVFADNLPITSIDYETACMDTTVLKYFTVTVASQGGQTLTVRDKLGQQRSVIGRKNIVARDMRINAPEATATEMLASSYAVIHQIDGVLNYQDVSSGYDNDWSSLAKARNYLSKYRIRE